ncbi:MAG: hypothetical protein IJ468_12430 [Lachnospiraceae bacterium]|nr:hypothetical protein [Lachnospiraceae bacterium]
MKIKMTLLSDAVFGSGISVPGGEDISVITDEEGFPYYKASSLKGVFREEAENLMNWKGKSESEIASWINTRLGKSGDSNLNEVQKIRFRDFSLSDKVKAIVNQQMKNNPEQIQHAFSYLRAFTALDEEGMVKKGSLRNVRCLKNGLIFYGEINCMADDEAMVEEILSCIKWVGTMRNRGFGKVKLERV